MQTTAQGLEIAGGVKGMGRRAAFCAFLLLLLSGCATTNDKNLASSLAVLMQQANEAAAAGSRDKAIGLLEKAAKENPTSKDPWLRTAEIHFDAGNYPQAMIAAQEALSRDPSNQEAKGLLVVSGLRVATRATSELRSDNALTSSTRGEAERLAKSLRESLGEKVLVPAVGNVRGTTAVRREESRSTKSRQVRLKAAPKPVLREAAKPHTPPATAVKTQSSADPFGSLR